jgi:hypothetical protein
MQFMCMLHPKNCVFIVFRMLLPAQGNCMVNIERHMLLEHICLFLGPLFPALLLSDY